MGRETRPLRKIIIIYCWITQNHIGRRNASPTMCVCGFCQKLRITHYELRIRIQFCRGGVTPPGLTRKIAQNLIGRRNASPTMCVCGFCQKLRITNYELEYNFVGAGFPRPLWPAKSYKTLSGGETPPLRCVFVVLPKITNYELRITN